MNVTVDFGNLPNIRVDVPEPRCSALYNFSLRINVLFSSVTLLVHVDIIYLGSLKGVANRVDQVVCVSRSLHCILSC